MTHKSHESWFTSLNFRTRLYHSLVATFLTISISSIVWFFFSFFKSFFYLSLAVIVHFQSLVNITSCAESTIKLRLHPWNNLTHPLVLKNLLWDIEICSYNHILSIYFLCLSLVWIKRIFLCRNYFNQETWLQINTLFDVLITTSYSSLYFVFSSSHRSGLFI